MQQFFRFILWKESMRVKIPIVYFTSPSDPIAAWTGIIWDEWDILWSWEYHPLISLKTTTNKTLLIELHWMIWVSLDAECQDFPLWVFPTANQAETVHLNVTRHRYKEDSIYGTQISKVKCHHRNPIYHSTHIADPKSTLDIILSLFMIFVLKVTEID